MSALDHKAAALTALQGQIWSILPSPALLLRHSDSLEWIVDCNPAAEQFLSASAAQMAGQGLHTRLRFDPPVGDALARSRVNRAPVFMNAVTVSAAGRTDTLCNLQIAPINDEQGTVMIMIVPREIAGRLGRTRSVHSAAKTAIGMSDMLAHEIKNPLAGIAGAAQLLSMSLGEEDQELTELIVAETRRVVKLLEQVEQFGDQRPPERRGINIHDVLERARRSAEVGFARHMELRDSYDPSLPDVHADPDQILQVVLNLLKNAAQAQPNGGTLRIRTYFERGLQVMGLDGRRVPLPVHIEIVDDGPGLPPEIADNIFEPFVSGRENGTGLGLALVSKIITAHEGWIEVKSRPGETVFRVSLPLVPAAPKEKDNS